MHSVRSTTRRPESNNEEKKVQHETRALYSLSSVLDALDAVSFMLQLRRSATVKNDDYAVRSPSPWTVYELVVHLPDETQLF